MTFAQELSQRPACMASSSVTEFAGWDGGSICYTWAAAGVCGLRQAAFSVSADSCKDSEDSALVPWIVSNEAGLFVQFLVQ